FQDGGGHADGPDRSRVRPLLPGEHVLSTNPRIVPGHRRRRELESAGGHLAPSARWPARRRSLGAARRHRSAHVDPVRGPGHLLLRRRAGGDRYADPELAPAGVSPDRAWHARGTPGRRNTGAGALSALTPRASSAAGTLGEPAAQLVAVQA